MDVFCVYCGRGNRERIGEGGGVVFIDRFGVCVWGGGAVQATWKKTMRFFIFFFCGEIF